ncbi:recombinase RecA, partial [Klebsiella pneumoniae]|nr:recombinase RecA [Klebsiella pneumoniae]
EGISREGELIDIGADLDIVQKSGAWYSYNEERLGQGRENAKQYMKENPSVAASVEERIRDHYGLNGEKTVTVEADNDDVLSLLDEE